MRRQLEPEGVPRGSVLLADRSFVQLSPTAVATGAARFLANLEAALLRTRHYPLAWSFVFSSVARLSRSGSACCSSSERHFWSTCSASGDFWRAARQAAN